MVYEWSARKALTNARKHGISFEEAATVFLDPNAWTFADPDHSEDESREITIGHTRNQKLIFVSHCDREGRTRIISARIATKRERKIYEKSID